MIALRYTTFAGIASLALLALSGCDNPACVFSPEGCNDDGPTGELGSAEAAPPTDGARILTVAPTLMQALPNGNGRQPSTPIVLEFSESMNPDSFDGAFELGDRFSGDTYPLLEDPVMAADGRIVVLQPATPLPDGRQFELNVLPNALVTDTTGQEWVTEAGAQILAFGTETAVEPTPQILITSPANGATGVSDINELTVIFDRAMDPSNFTPIGFAVTVGGVPPASHPFPTTGLSGVAAVPSVWLWSLENEFGQRTGLGAGSSAQLTLSSVGAELTDTAGGTLPPTSISFSLSGLEAPIAGFKPFGAQDALGITDLENNSVPILQVELAQPAIAGDELFIYAFGQSPDNNLQVAFERRVDVPDGAMMVDLFPSDLRLLDTDGDPILADGGLRLVAESRRGSVRTGVRVLDGSPFEDGIQDYAFDSLAPSLVTLGLVSDPTNFLRSDQRDLVAYGIASESLAGARVTSPAFGNNVNGPLDPPAPAQMGSTNVVVAAPILVGILEPGNGPVPFDFQAFDQALNTPSVAYPGVYEQVGVASTGGAISTDVRVWVHDSESLEPLQGARVMTHQDGGGLAHVATGFTAANGSVTLDSAAAGETIVTVDFEGYHLFTFYGVPREQVQVLLEPVSRPPAQWTGQVQTDFPNAPIDNVDVFISDTRLQSEGPLWREPLPCVVDSGQGVYRCDFVPELGRINRVGFGSFIAGDLDLPQAAFSPLGFLRAFGWETGQTRLETDGLGSPSILFTDTLLISGIVEDLPIEVPSQDLSTVAMPSLGMMSNAPRVMVDGISPGMERPVLIGLGIAYSAGADTWEIRSCIPGVVDGVVDNMDDQLGALVEFGTLDADHKLRVEVEDDAGNLVTIRRAFSALNGSLTPTDVPQLLSPAPGGMVTGPAYVLQTTDPLRDGLGMGGMYEIRLVDDTGRVWFVWRQDPTDAAANLTVELPNIAAQGGDPLNDGPIFCQISYYAAGNLDDTQFMWTDLYKNAELYARSAPVVFTQN